MRGGDLVNVDFRNRQVTDGPVIRPYQHFGRQELIEMAVQAGVRSGKAVDERDYSAAKDYDALYKQYTGMVGSDHVTLRGIERQVVRRLDYDPPVGPEAC
jgi:hypothetical protein